MTKKSVFTLHQVLVLIRFRELGEVDQSIIIGLKFAVCDIECRAGVMFFVVVAKAVSSLKRDGVIESIMSYRRIGNGVSEQLSNGIRIALALPTICEKCCATGQSELL